MSNHQLALVIGLYILYKLCKPHYIAWVKRKRIYQPHQVALANRFLDGLTAEQILQVSVWLRYGTDSYAIINSLGAHRFDVLRVQIAPTLRYNPRLIDEALSRKI